MKWVTGLGTPDDVGGAFTVKTGDLDDGQIFEIGADDRASQYVRAVVFDPDARSAVLRCRVVVGIVARSRDAPRRHDRSAGGHAVVQDDARRARDARDAARALRHDDGDDAGSVDGAQGVHRQGAASRPAVFRRTSPTTRGTRTARPSTKPRSPRKWISRPRWALSSSSSTRGGGRVMRRRRLHARVGHVRSRHGPVPERARSVVRSRPPTRHAIWPLGRAGADRSRDDQQARRRHRTVPGDRRQSVQPERPQFAGGVGPDLFRRSRGTDVDHGPARRSHRGRAPRLPEVGQQLLGQLQSCRSTATAPPTATSRTCAASIWSAMRCGRSSRTWKSRTARAAANRLSLDMLAYSDATWLDDRTSPSGLVRHDLEGLLDIFPAPYLLSFAVTTEWEPMADNGDGLSDIPVIMRSRMPGLLGLSVRLGDMGDGSRASMAKQIDLYKRLRPILLDGVSFVLGPQQVSFPDAAWSGWDVVAARVTDHRRRGVDGVRNAGCAAERPRAPERAQTGRHVSGRVGRLRRFGRRERLRSDGEGHRDRHVGDLTRSHVLILRAQPGAPPRLLAKR